MARPSRTGGKTSRAKARDASPAKDRKTTKTKPRIAPAANQVKHRPASDLSKDLKEARERLAATAEILKVIASSPDDVQPVLEAVAERAMSLLDAWSVLVTRFDGELLHFGAARGALPDTEQFLRNQHPMRPEAAVFPGRCILERSAVNISDAQADPSPQSRERARLRGFRAHLSVPMLRDGQPNGVISVSRREAGAFAANEVELLQTFADQAVIAIENVRLFNEVQAKTADLSESLQQQTATADVLKVISRSAFDLQNILDTLIESAALLCTAERAALIHQKGQTYVRAALHGFPKEAVAEMKNVAVDLNSATIASRALRQCAVVHVADVNADPDYPKTPAQILGGVRTVISVPLVREGRPIGAITLSRTRVDPFTPKQIDLIRTFADQAVIAIENARLFNETKEALERQTATAEILKVIASSPDDVQPVFDAIATSANRLIGGFSTAVYRVIDDILHLMAFTPTSPKADEALKAGFPLHRKEVPPLALVQSGETAQIADAETADPQTKRLGRARGWRSVTFTPLMSQGAFIGFIVCTRRETGVLADHHVQLLRTFADQAVIAIENVRLFNETQEALERQTATADILKVIASSPSDVQPVFEAVVNSAARLFEPCSATITTLKEGKLYWNASAQVIPSFDHEAARAVYPIPFDPVHSPSSRAVLERRIIAIPDTHALDTPEFTRIISAAGGFRSITFVPLIHENRGIGTIILTHPQAGFRFSDKQLAQLQTFADQAVIAIENVRLFEQVQARTGDLSEALQQQTATADVLKVISRSAFDLKLVLDTLTESAARLCNADMAAIARKDDRGFYHATNYNFAVDWVKFTDIYRLQPGRDSVIGRALLANAAVQIPDVLADPEYAYSDMQKAAGYRTLLGVPLLRDKEPVGVLFLGRKTVEPFTDKQIELVQTFADQAVIAIENVRLFDEVQAKTRDLSESLQFQTASSEVLKVISSSPDILQPVLDAIVQTSRELCGSDGSTIFLVREGKFHVTAVSGDVPKHLEYLRDNPASIDEPLFGRLVRERRTLHFANVMDDPELSQSPRNVLGGPRALLVAPLLRDGEPLGAIVLRQSHLKPFTSRQIQAIEVFADQAVIAISNVGLFEEVQAKTRDLSEALVYQTASGNILKVIASSPTDVGPVLKAIVESACELCGAYDASVLLKDGNDLRNSAHHGPIPVGRERWPISRKWTPGRAFLDQKPVHVHDILSAEGDEFPDGQQVSRRTGLRSTLSVPLLREGESIGAIALRRTEVHPFSDKQIALLQTFADQAVIAIENVRLFDEVQARTGELSQSVDELRALGEVSQAVNSTVDLETVLNTIVAKATQLSGTEAGAIYVFDQAVQEFHLRATYGMDGAIIREIKDRRIHIGDTLVGEAVQQRMPIQIPDIQDDPNPLVPDVIVRAGFRALLIVPLLGADRTVGALVVRRKQPGEFPKHTVDLLQTFAAQSVLAIQNARLFEEVQAKTRDLTEALTYQTGSSNILSVIASSPTDVEPVLKAIVESACELCDAVDAIVLLKDGDGLRVSAHHGPIPVDYERLTLSRKWVAGQAFLVRKPVHVHDILSAEGDQFPDTRQRTARTGTRSILSVPLLREGKSIGTVVLRRTEVHPFSDKQIALLQTFADQAVIAIGNVRMFEQVQERTKELAASLDELRSAQDRLVQTEKLASLGQLTAGIAHEIKNPLNFVNNFSAVSAELTGELSDLLKDATLTDKMRQEVEDLTRLLQDNLEKVVQHGKRADSIVKNMLLHSREGSGERRPADINAIVDESLNLAYHGARAEKADFNVTMQRSFDPAVGIADVYPQEITRVLLNLISNGFYATAKRKTEAGDGFEPTVIATTKDLGDKIEIRIRDNGTGIPDEIKVKIFNPFFTTKPAGEGTGLGLSMSHDIIVKQHCGKIEVETEPGQFTEFRIVLPRTNNFTTNDHARGPT